MTDTTGATPPFPGFPGFPPAEMLDKMWDMMRLTPFGGAFAGMQPGAGQGFSPSLSAMSDMMAPLVSVEELDKRITDMRAVEQWLKLNLNMLQSAIQALEVQRATLATLRAFGSFAQASMAQAAARAGAPAEAEKPEAGPSWARPASAQPEAPADAGAAAGEEPAAAGAPAGGAFDPSSWWSLLQSQFNQLAQFAMTQPAAAPGAEHAEASDLADFAQEGEPQEGEPQEGEPQAPADEKPAPAGKAAGAAAGEAPKPAAKRPAAKRAAAKSAAKAAGRTPEGEK